MFKSKLECLSHFKIKEKYILTQMPDIIGIKPNSIFSSEKESLLPNNPATSNTEVA